MSKLTSERVNGIKTGYWSPSKKDDLVQRLGRIEHESPRLIEQICDDCCKHPFEMGQEELDERCQVCPLEILERLIGGEA